MYDNNYNPHCENLVNKPYLSKKPTHPGTTRGYIIQQHHEDSSYATLQVADIPPGTLTIQLDAGGEERDNDTYICILYMGERDNTPEEQGVADKDYARQFARWEREKEQYDALLPQYEAYTACMAAETALAVEQRERADYERLKHKYQE